MAEYQLRAISPDEIESALAKARQYRLLNEPRESESICRDILAVDPGHQEATTILILAMTDQFRRQMRITAEEVRELLPRLEGYEREYYAGVINERWGKALWSAGYKGDVVYEWLTQALDSYGRAESMAPSGNPDATLRWNTVVRMLQREPDRLRPAGVGKRLHDAVDSFDDEVPYR